MHMKKMQPVKQGELIGAKSGKDIEHMIQNIRQEAKSNLMAEERFSKLQYKKQDLPKKNAPDQKYIHEVLKANNNAHRISLITKKLARDHLTSVLPNNNTSSSQSRSKSPPPEKGENSI